MASISVLNPKAEFAKAQHAFNINLAAARGLFDVLKTNLGPKGTMKMLVSGAGDIKITKDGNVLLHEMQIQHPTASLIARVATAQDDMTGDGTTSNVLLIAELLKQADLHTSEGLHPRLITEGFELARNKCLEILSDCRIEIDKDMPDRSILLSVVGTSLRTKLHADLANLLTTHVVDAVLAVRTPDEPLDLHRVELMQMQHKTDMDTTLIKGIVLDHGGRHPDMPKRVTNAYILTCNVSFEYEKTEVNSSFFYKTAEERSNLIKSEREFIDMRVQKVIDLKNKVCDAAGGDPKPGFVVINQKGIDPFALDAFAREGILALRRAKRRNMERVALACGGYALNSVDDMTPDCLGHAGLVYEYILGEEKFTFIEECKTPHSVTLLMKGPNKHTLTQLKDAINDGLRAAKNTLEDGCVVPGAGAFEIVAHRELSKFAEEVKGRARLGVQAFANALLVIPKVLAKNAGHDAQDVMVKLLVESTRVEKRTGKNRPTEIVGVDLATGDALVPAQVGIYDNFIVKKQIISSCAVIASNILLVDEIMRAGLSSLKG
ncbi:Chaperonin containing T-complex polypeptide subunit zeta [Fasciola gigantica]|uniref:Chaperonin containing T-complex polypeptide subunit zeta n=1 Tax=Fasciola gigantica TaxID=46835 RepID=A0A504YPN0_FASGI|nr:Chaperonin containing T-complex polypeptide subunit zeta [Fasciola gigantica]